MLKLIIISQPIVTRARKRCLDLLCLLPSSLSRPSSVLPLLSARNRTALAPALLVKMTKIKPAKLQKCFPSSTRSIGLTLGTSLKNGFMLEWAVAKWRIDSDDCYSTLSQNWPAINTSIIFFMEGCNDGLIFHFPTYQFLQSTKLQSTHYPAMLKFSLTSIQLLSISIVVTTKVFYNWFLIVSQVVVW